MSVPHLRVDRALLVNRSLSLTAKLVLAALLDRRNKETGKCNPKREKIAEDLGMDIGDDKGVRKIARALAELRKAGMIRTVEKSQRANFYEISLTGSFCQDKNVTTEPISAVTKSVCLPGQKCHGSTLLTEPILLNLAAASSGVDSAHAAAAPKPTEKPSPKPPARATDDGAFRLVREALYALAPLVRLPLPDDDLIRRVIEAARGAPGEDIAATLVALYKAGQLRNMRSWGFIPLKIGDCARRATATA